MVLLALLAPATARAAGFWLTDQGASTLGRGGANFAEPDDPIALYTNPAGLAGLEGLQIMIGANAIFDNRQWTRAPDDFATGSLVTYDPVENGQDMFPPSPNAFISYNFAGVHEAIGGLTMAFGVYGPPRNDRSWPADGPQRYSEVESHNLQIHYSLAGAYELPWWELRVGFTGMLIDQIIDTRLALNLPEFGPEDTRYDIVVQANASGALNPAATMGFSLKPFDLQWLRVAFSYQLPYSPSTSGTITATLGEEAERLGSISGDQVEVELDLPGIVRASVQYVDPEGDFDVEFAFVHESWSRNEAITFRPQGVSFDAIIGGPRPIGEINIENNWQDTFSLRLGGSYRLIEDLLLIRAGAFYEPSPVPLNRTSPASFALDKIAVAAGTRIDFPLGFWFDFTAALITFISRDVTASETTLVNPLGATPAEQKTCAANTPCWPVANGKYENLQLLFMAALGVEIPI